MSTLETFRNEVEQFLTANQLSATRFGVEALKDPRFVHELRMGRAPSMTTADRVRDFMKTRSVPAEAERVA